MKKFIYIFALMLLSIIWPNQINASTEDKTPSAGDTELTSVSLDTIVVAIDSTVSDIKLGKDLTLQTDSLADIALLGINKKAKQKKLRLKSDGSIFVPNPNRALWLSLVLPGAGQIYNRKYWKLPILYGGFLGCTYALLWNQQMYDDYSQAYLDIMDDDPNTASYKNMLPMGYDITGREEQFQKIFKHKRDYYRKYRDMSIFAFFGVYLLSVVDAYVDAQLSTFDISKDLSISVEPAIIHQDHYLGSSNSRAAGVKCGLSF